MSMKCCWSSVGSSLDGVSRMCVGVFHRVLSSNLRTFVSGNSIHIKKMI